MHVCDIVCECVCVLCVHVRVPYIEKDNIIAISFAYSQNGFILFLLGVALTLLFILIQIFGIAYALSFFG